MKLNDYGFVCPKFQWLKRQQIYFQVDLARQQLDCLGVLHSNLIFCRSGAVMLLLLLLLAMRNGLLARTSTSRS